MTKIFNPSVADPGCLSWIPDPYFYLSRILCHSFFCSLKLHKNENYVSFELLKKKIGPKFKRIVEYFTKKIVTKLLKIWVWDPGSGKKPIPDPGSRYQKGTGSRIRIRNTAHSSLLLLVLDLGS
jgi:hypothetical protein